MADKQKPNIIVDTNNKIQLIIGDFNSDKFHKILASSLMDKKTVLALLVAGAVAGVLLALLV